MPDTPLIARLANQLSEAADADIIFCNSPMRRGVERFFVDLCRKRVRRTNVILLLVTSGGDADAAFRIARHLQCSYSKYVCLVPGWCKSAGTLVAIGAHEVAFGVHGELGPLDVQMAKKDELLGSQSGLTVTSGLTALHEKALSAFQHFFYETILDGNGRLSAQTASHIAVELANGLFAPISSQIDPIHIGEAYRSMAVGMQYGERLIENGKNVKAGSLEKVIGEYPSHGFVIDRIEALTIFKKVRECTELEQALVDALGDSAVEPLPKSFVTFLNKEKEESQDADPNDVDQEKRDDLRTEETRGDAEEGHADLSAIEAGGNEVDQSSQSIEGNV